MRNPYTLEGQCTWYVANEWLKRFGSDALFFDHTGPRDAKTWPDYAARDGLTLSINPVPGAAAVFKNLSQWGHVALVEEVNEDGSVNISEYNYVKPETFGTRKNVRGASIYILPPQVPMTEEFQKAWKKMQDAGIYSTHTKQGTGSFTKEETAVINARLLDYVEKKQLAVNEVPIPPSQVEVSYTPSQPQQ